MSASTCSNVEIKAKIPNSMEETRKIAQRLAGPEYKPEILIQVDTFFNAPLCRLKLRNQNGKETFLISYSRPDNTDGPKLSTFIKTPIVDHNSMRNLLEMSMGIKGIVKKQRELYLVSWKGLTSRIHLDIVEGLGEFIEFEVRFKNHIRFARTYDIMMLLFIRL